ncbi:MAG: ribosomal protein [Candidatus Angelobacter sp.]|jgi:four helix bundle protein|nr:ribosomal protein [Candidatus Angelobacter sp.]
MAGSYKDLIAWQKSIVLVTEVYKATKSFPKEEIYGLVSQLRRAAVSIPSNIAEGHGRLTNSERKHFLGQARGSLLELETQIVIAENLGYVEVEESKRLQLLAFEVGRIISGLMRSLQEKSIGPSR